LQGLTINEAAETTGWSSRMLRYVEQTGLIEPPRTASGYRIYGPAELQRLRTLRELIDRFGCGLSDVAFARRMTLDHALRGTLESWFEQEARRPREVDSGDWLRFEQEKHERLLAAAR
jgi:DNA-binding transcriptional MerR regulator